MRLSRRRMALLVLAGGVWLTLWSALGLWPFPVPIQSISAGDASAMRMSPSILLVFGGLVVAFVGFVGLVATIGD